MRHGKAGKKLGRTPSHRKAMFRNMVTSLLQHERIVTTEVKAKEIRRQTEKMLTLGKRGDLHARRKAVAFIRSDEVVKRVFSQYAQRYANRDGGYTRVLKLEPRAGDNAPMALVELVDRPVIASKDQSPKSKEKAAKGVTPKKEIKAKKEPKEKKDEDDKASDVETKPKKKAPAKITAEKKADKAEPKKKTPAKKTANKEEKE